LILWQFGSVVNALDGSVGLEVLGHLLLDLSEVLRHVGVAVLELFLGELGHLSGHHALLVLEEAVGASEEAIEDHHFLEESQLGVGFLLALGFYGLLDGRVDLRVNLFGREGGNAGVKGGSFSGVGEGSLDETSNLLNMSLSIDLSGFNTSLLLNSIYQTNWYAFLGKV